MDRDTEPSQFLKETFTESLHEFLEYSVREPEQIRHKEYEIFQWTEDGRVANTRTVAVPSAREWAKEPHDDATKIGSLVEALVADDNIPMIQSQTEAARMFNRVIEEIRIEANRGDSDELRNDPDIWNALYSEETTIEYVAPIVGLGFDDHIQITDDLVIRRLSEFEKELMLNAKAMGGGSVNLQTAIQIGNLTHAAVHKNTPTVEDGWEDSLAISFGISPEDQEELKNLRVALRLIHPEGFNMSIRHVVDRTFYPSVISSHEMHGSIAPGGFAEPQSVSNADRVVEYYQLVSEADEDEGLRVAIDRLESSYQKVSNADGVVDVVIGIEALLSSGRSGSFQEVRRRAAVLSGKKASYSELGRLQNLRNATVHGEETQVNHDDLQHARDLLSVLLSQVIRITIEEDITRVDVIEVLDEAITKTVENKFNELLSEFDSM